MNNDTFICSHWKQSIQLKRKRQEIITQSKLTSWDCILWIPLKKTRKIQSNGNIYWAPILCSILSIFLHLEWTRWSLKKGSMAYTGASTIKSWTMWVNLILLTCQRMEYRQVTYCFLIFWPEHNNSIYLRGFCGWMSILPKVFTFVSGSKDLLTNKLLVIYK